MPAPRIGDLLGSPSDKDREDFEELLRRAAAVLRVPEKASPRPLPKRLRWLGHTVTRLLRIRAA
jgi:hypothetical protein